MKLLLYLFLLLFVKIGFSQHSSINFEASTHGVTSPELLAKQLTANDTTDRQKVYSIFKWVTANIDYNVRSFQNRGYSSSNDYWIEEDQDTAASLKPLNERVAEMVLKRRT